MLGGPVSPYTALSGPQLGLGAATSGGPVLDINPEQDRLCGKGPAGMECKGRTSAVTIKYKAVQLATNAAAQVLTVPHTPLVIDGVIGRKTAYLFNAVIQEYAKKKTLAPGERAYVWANDPRTEKYDTYASLISMQPQYARETMDEITASVPRPTVGPTIMPPGTVPPTATTTPPTITPPTTTTTPSAPAPVKFWTRRKKIALASAALLAAGLLAFVLLKPKPDHF